ncbi:MAG: hypothetical protein QF464_03430, partial [Myxococcota bacterium]|nr:hypothetical protein [Myxococcota bacterium]
MGKSVILIVAPDVGARALVGATIDTDQVDLVAARCVTSAREAVQKRPLDLALIDGELAEAPDLLAELAGTPVLWIGAEEVAGVVGTLSRPIDVVELQIALEQNLGIAPEGRDEPVEMVDRAARVVETERDTLLAEVEVMRHESERARREMTDHVAELRREFEGRVVELEQQLQQLGKSFSQIPAGAMGRGSPPPLPS